MPYNPNIQHIYGEVTGGGGTSDVNITNDPLNVAIGDTLDVNVTNASLAVTVADTLDVSVTNTPTVNVGNSVTNTFDQYVLAYLPITSNQSVNGVLAIKEY